MAEYHGHMTHKDGTHTALSREEAEALWKYAEDQSAKEAEQMPEAWDATSQIISAKQRLRRLGWSEGGGLRVRRGDECAVIELGSTGMWTGWLDDDGKYVHYAGSVSSRRKVWLKPISDLTDVERERLAAGDKDAAEWVEQECKIYAAMSEIQSDLKEQS